MGESLTDAEIEARWYAWALPITGGDGDRARAAAQAAMTAIEGGWDPLAAAQNVIGPVAVDAFQEAPDAGFYRAEGPVAALAIVGGVPFLWWWAFQLLSFARRQQLPGSRSPWWILAPIYNLFLVVRAFSGIRQAQVKAGQAPLSMVVAALLYTGTIFAANLTSQVTSVVPALVLDATSLGLGAATIYYIQLHANRLQRAEQPGPAPTPNITPGMILALAIGILFEGLLILTILVGPFAGP